MNGLKRYSKLKVILASYILHLPNFSNPFKVVVDACGKGIGEILKQEGHPVAYGSCRLKVHELNYPTHDLELLEVMFSLNKWRRYLLSQRLVLITNHKSLKWIFTQPDLHMQQQRWVEYLQEFHFEIKFRLGK